MIRFGAARFVVRRCDEGGTLQDSEGREVDHTWDVVDRRTDKTVANTDTRRAAREVAREYNAGVKS